jgi:hypothetical protein
MEIEEIKINGELLKIYGPAPDGCFSIADKGGWLPGIYADKDASKEAFRLTLQDCGFDRLQNLADTINRVCGENRFISTADFKGVI